LENTKHNQRVTFSRIPTIIEYPNLMDIQVKFFKEFLMEDVSPAERPGKGLQSVFESVFRLPIAAVIMNCNSLNIIWIT